MSKSCPENKIKCKKTKSDQNASNTSTHLKLKYHKLEFRGYKTNG